MPVWQQFYQKHRNTGFELITVAMEAERPDLARRFAEEAAATYKVLLDREAVLAVQYGFKAIPNGWIIDEAGIIRYKLLGTFSIKKEDIALHIESWLCAPADTVGASVVQQYLAKGPLSHGVDLLRQGRRREAVEAWIEALEIEPDNLVIRKQIWQLLHPERFHPRVDFDWQREQETREEQRGFRQANPLPVEW